jgi:maltose O-acetyltransferase
MLKISYDLRKIKSLFLGHISTTLWFFPKFALYLHQLRGVKFKKINSVFIGRGVTIDNRYPELVEIGEDVWITSGCIILTHSYSTQLQRKKFNLTEKIDKVIIESGVFIGAGSIVCPGVRLFSGAYIAAGSVVTGDVLGNSLYAGNPARFIKKLG